MNEPTTMTMDNAKYSCIMLTSDREHLSSAAETFARKLFDVKHVSRYARDARHRAADVTDLTRDGEIDFLINYLSPVIVPERCAVRSFYGAGQTRARNAEAA